MSRKIRVGLLFGGRSGEHEVSLLSAASVFTHIDRNRFDVVPVCISKQGKWMLPEDALKVLERGIDDGAGTPVALVAEPNGHALLRSGPCGPCEPVGSLDVVFPVLHGTFGEDGAVQGLLELADIPYVGSGVLASSVGMDKDLMKRLFREKGLPVVEFVSVLRKDFEARPGQVVDGILSKLNLPVFVKPANLGSSVGISKVKHADDLEAAIRKACLYDRKIVVEEGVKDAREIECAVLGNDDPVTSPPGEIIAAREFYDYVAKYLDPATELKVPAELPADVAGEIRRISVEAFRCIDAAGLSRVDFFVERGTHRVWLNEINTIPGFTAVSMYPRMMQAAGISYSDLITRLIELAIERHGDKSRRQTTYEP